MTRSPAAGTEILECVGNHLPLFTKRTNTENNITLSHNSKAVRILWFRILTYSGKCIAFYLVPPKLIDGQKKARRKVQISKSGNFRNPN